MQKTTPYQSIVLIGKVTSGKGTQASGILETFGGTLFSVGNKVRENATFDTVLGHNVKRSYEQGLLMPNWLAAYWMMHCLLEQHANDRVIFEAVARKPDEAVIFHEIHEWTNRPYIVFHLDVPDQIVRERSAARQRDVVDMVVEERLAEFTKYTLESLKFFESQNKLVKIDGTKSVASVREDIFTYLTKSS